MMQAEEGKILLAGALAEPVDGALFIWKDASPEVSLYGGRFRALPFHRGMTAVTCMHAGGETHAPTLCAPCCLSAGD